MERTGIGERNSVVLEVQSPDEPRPYPPVTSFDAFYVREWSGVAALAHSLCGSWAAAEELARDAFVAAFRNWSRVSQLDRPDAWVRRVVVNAATSALRRRGAEVRAMVRLRRVRRPDTTPSVPAEQDEFWATVRSLPNRQAEVVALHYLNDCSVADIA